MLSKENQKDKAERLLETIRELEEQKRDRETQIEEINKDFDYHPEILALQKEIENKQRAIKNYDKEGSRLVSQLQNSVVKTAKSKSNLEVPEKKTIKRLSKAKK